MEEVISGVFKGFGILLLDFIFWHVCYRVGLPVCKLVTLGRYPSSSAVPHQRRPQGVVCGITGLLVIIGVFFVLITYV